MKKLIMALVVLGAMTSCAKARTHFITDQKLAEERRELKGFECIVLSGSLDVKYRQGDNFSVVVKAPQKVIKNVETRVVGNCLTVNMKGIRSVFKFTSADVDDVTVYVTSPDFLGIELKGSGDFEGIGHIDTDTLSIALKGSGDIDFDDVICDKVSVSLVGSGDVEVKNVKTQLSDIELVGSGDVKMRFDNSGVVTSRLKGSGDITLTGRVKDHKSQVRGSGDINTQRLTIVK